MAQFHALTVGLELAYDRGSRGGTNLHQKRYHPHQPLLGARSSVIPWEYETTLLGERHKLAYLMAASNSSHLFFVILKNCFPFCLVRPRRLTFHSFPRNFYFLHFHVASNAKSYFRVAVAVVAYSRLSIGREVRNCGGRAKKWTKDWGQPLLDLFLSLFFLRPVHTTWEPGTGYRRRSCVSTLNKGEWWILTP